MAIETDALPPLEQVTEQRTPPTMDQRLFAGGVSLIGAEAFGYDNGFNPIVTTLAGVVLAAIVARSIR